MPDSMFGRPSQHLLPSYPQAGAGASDPHPVPVPLPFKDFRFSSIGKQPELLSRISLQQDNTDYHSPTPSPTSTPPPPSTNDLRSKSSSRPTLLQQLAGGSASTSQSGGPLASRIQMDDNPSRDIGNTAFGTAARFPSPPLRFRAVMRTTEDASLIPPVEVLHQPPDSAPPTPASWAPTLELTDVDSLAFSTPLVNATTITPSRAPTPPTVTTNTAFREPAGPLPSLAVIDAPMRDLQSSSSTTAVVDLLVSRQERLHSISARLANLASPIRTPSSESPPPNPSSVRRASADIVPDQPSQSQVDSSPIVLHYPYSASQSSGRVRSSINNAQMNTNGSSLTLVPSPTTLIEEYQTQSKAIVAAVQNLHSVLNAAHHAHIDNQNVFVHQIRIFEEQRVAFEQTKREEEASLQQKFQELQQKCEELNAKEVLLASLEKENKAREEARKGVLAKRQAQEEEKRAAEAKRVQEVQEQITAAMNEIKEIEALKPKCQVEKLASETIPDDLPTEPKEGMNEEETAAIKSRNDLLRALKHLRRMHADKVQKLEEVHRTLRRSGEERKKREAEKAERRRVAEEEHPRTHVDMKRAGQLLDGKRRRLEAEKKLQEVEDDGEHAQLLVAQQAHAEAQAHALGRTEATNGKALSLSSHPEEASTSQQQRIANTTRFHAVCEDNSLSAETTNAMDVDEDRRALTHRTVPSPNVHTSPRASQPQKKGKPISGGVMLAAPIPKAGGEQLPPKPLTTTSLSPGHVAVNLTNSVRTSPTIPVSVERAHTLSTSAQPASGFNRALNGDIRPTPEYKPAFSRTPKSQTILDVANGGSQELSIGPVAGVSPTQQNVNLRHLKRFRGRVEGHDSGDRSVRTIQLKSEENADIPLKKEDHDDQAHELAQASLSTNSPTISPPRSAIIPPPRPWMSRKPHEAPVSQTDSPSSYPVESNKLLLARREAEATAHKQPREVHPQNTFAQLLPRPETTNSLLLGPEYAGPQASESRVNTDERPMHDCAANTAPEPVSANLSHELDGEDPSRSNRRFSDEPRRARNVNSSRRVSNHYSPPVVASRFVPSPTLPPRPLDSWRPQNSSSGPRAGLMRATSPTTGRKRPSEFNDNEASHRVRRQRGDLWIAQDHDRNWADSYRPRWDRRLESESDERRAVYRVPASPLDRIHPHPSDVSKATYENKTYASQERTTPSARWEQSHRRTEDDDTYQRYQPSAPAHNALPDQHHTDDRAGQTYEPVTDERMDVQSDPALLARMHSTQRFPPRGRGRAEPSRGRSDFGKGRGRGIARGGTPLLDRLSSGPLSLGGRLT